MVDHRDGPARVTGDFGTGKTTALIRRAERLRADGRRPLLLHHRDLVGVALAIIGRHERAMTLAGDAERVGVVLDLLRPADQHHAEEIASTVLAFESSFLGDEELRVHAHAAGVLDRAEELIEITARYQRGMAERRLADAGGAVVIASLLLRDPAIVDAERARFDELLIDDYQLATFASARLVTQLVGRDGNVVVAGNPAAAVSTAPFATDAHLDRFSRRFEPRLDVDLRTALRSAGVPSLQIVDDDEGLRAAARQAIQGAAARGITSDETAVLPRDLVEAAVGREWPMVVVPGVTDGRWPAPRPHPSWFDPELFHGPDVPDDDERDRRWLELERRRFAVATSRATRFLVVLATSPVSPLVGELIG